MKAILFHSFVFYCALLCFHHCILRTDELIRSAPQLQECLINLLSFLQNGITDTLRFVLSPVIMNLNYIRCVYDV